MVALAAAVALHAVVQALVVGTGLLGVPLSRPLAWAVLALAVTGAVALARRFRAPADAPTAPSADPDAPPDPRAPRPSFSVSLAAAVAVTWCLWTWGQGLLLAWLREPVDWDGLYYHLPAINGWVAAGRVAWLTDAPDLPYVNGYPLGAEALAFLIQRAFGDSRLVDGVNLLYWPLAAFAVATLAGRLGAPGAWRALAGSLVFVAPVFVGQSVTCYTDPAFASCLAAALASLAVALEAGRRGRWETALLLGGASGLVAGVKGMGAPYAVVLLGAATVVAWRGADASTRHRRLAWLGLAVATAALVGGGWYARNLFHTGNPIHPVQVKFGALVLHDGFDIPQMLRDNMPPWLAAVPGPLRVPYAWLQPDAPVRGYAPTTGMGYAWLLGGLPAIALAWGLRRRLWPADPAPRRLLAALTAVAAVMFVLHPAGWWARFTVWLHALGLACLVAVVARLRTGAPAAARAALLGWVLLVAGVGAVEAQIALVDAWREGRRPDAVRPRDLYPSSLEAIAPGLADSTGGPDGFVAATRLARSRWSRMGTLLGGALAMPLGQRTVAWLPETVGEPELARLARDRVEWVVWDVAEVGPVPAPLAARADTVRSYRHDPGMDFRFLRLRR